MKWKNAMFNIVCDGDGVLFVAMDKLNPDLNEYSWMDCFKRNNLCHTISYEENSILKKHTIIVRLGANEFIQYILSKPDVTFSLFSAADKILNEPRMRVFLKQIVTEKLANSIKVFSFEDCVAQKTATELCQWEMFKLPGGEAKKSIKALLKTGKLIELPNEVQPDAFKAFKKGIVSNTVVLDDNRIFTQHGEEKNFLWVTTCDEDTFYDFNSDSLDLNSPSSVEANSIFYMTGLLETVFERAAAEKKPLAEVLFELQWQPREQPANQIVFSNMLRFKEKHQYSSFFYEYTHPEQSIAYYKKGLEILQCFNPELTFITQATLQPPVENKNRLRRS